MTKLKNKIPEKWLILICCCLFTGATTGTNTITGLFYNPVCRELGILKGTFNLQSLIGTAVTTATLMILPKVMKKVSLKRMLSMAVITVSICYVLDSFNTGVAGFFAVNMVRSFASSFYNSLVTFLIINSWFKENNGTASALMMCFSGAAGAILSPIISGIISNQGWRNGYRAVAATVLIFSLPMILYPRNLIAADTEEGNGDDSSDETLINAPRNGVTYVVLVIFLVTCYSLAAFMSHVSGYCEAEGFSAEVGAVALSCNLVGNMLFKLIDGLLGDRFGVRKVNRIILALPFFSYILFLTAKSSATVYLAGFLSGAANCGAGLAANLIIRDVYGNARFGEVRSATSLFTQPAYALFTALAGYTYDFTGNYDLMLFVFLACAVIQVLMLELLYIRKGKGLVYRIAEERSGA